MKQEIIQTVRQLVGDDYLHFDTPVQIKTSPHHLPFNIWAICVSPAGQVHVMDSHLTWHEADDLAIQSVYQRIKSIQKKIA